MSADKPATPASTPAAKPPAPAAATSAPARAHGTTPAAAATPAPAGETAADPKPAKKPGKLSKASASAKVAAGSALEVIVGVARNLRSPDRPTRRWAITFFACLGGLVLVFAVAIHHVNELRKVRQAEAELEAKAALQIEEATKKHAQDLKLTERTVSIGIFSLELKAPPGGRKLPRGVYNVAEFEIVVQTDTAETKAYLEENFVQARNQVTNGLTPMDREEFLSKDGKRALRKLLIKRLNQWMTEGKIEELFISNQVVN